MSNDLSTYSYIDHAPFTPRGVVTNTQTSGLVTYYRRYLFQKAVSVLKFTLPEYWDEDFFKAVLFCDGYECIFPTMTYGVVALPCTLSGYNLFYQPARAIVANPLLIRTYDMQIGRQCTLVKLTPDYFGIMDLVNDYAEQLALVNMAFCVNAINSHTANVFFADSKAEAASYEKAQDEVMSGKPFVVLRKNLKAGAAQPFAGRVRENFIIPELLAAQRRIENNFATAIGLPNTNIDKKERMSVDEVNANDIETQTLMSMYIDSIRKAFDQANEKYGRYMGTELKVDWRVKPEEVNEDADSNTDVSRPS